ncbi:MAG: hypothetical protein M3065_14785, partial [Actinomycetota bacterium]|nr:hypothetical protein [Actinomycetota bacterium]
MDWTADPAADDLTKVVRDLISLRTQVEALRAPRFPEPAPALAGEPVADTGLAWFDPDGAPVSGQDWDNPQGHSFAVVFPGEPSAPSVLVMSNAYWGPVDFSLPSAPAGAWTVVLDTTRENGAPAAGAPLGA